MVSNIGKNCSIFLSCPIWYRQWPIISDLHYFATNCKFLYVTDWHQKIVMHCLKSRKKRKSLY